MIGENMNRTCKGCGRSTSNTYGWYSINLCHISAPRGSRTGTQGIKGARPWSYPTSTI